MFRILNAVSVIALLAAAGAVYHVKYSAAFEAQHIAALRDEIRSERERIAVLNAEWARRTAPGRIQALAQNHLDMQGLDVDHMDQLASLPPKPEANSDALGGMIEALVDGPSSGTAKETPRPASGTAPRPAVSAPATRLPGDAPLTEGTSDEEGNSGTPLPLSALPAAGNMAPPRPGFAGPQGSLVNALDPMALRPLLPPAAVGR